MNEAIWIVLCLFSSIGIAQCICWLAGQRKRPKGLRAGYHIVTLHDDPAGLEAQLRYGISCLGWGACSGEVVLLLDMGLGPESLAVCERFIRQRPGLLLCDEKSLLSTIREMDALQGAGESDIL